LGRQPIALLVYRDPRRVSRASPAIDLTLLLEHLAAAPHGPLSADSTAAALRWDVASLPGAILDLELAAKQFQVSL
jgi:hypothetical protein